MLEEIYLLLTHRKLRTVREFYKKQHGDSKSGDAMHNERLIIRTQEAKIRLQ